MGAARKIVEDFGGDVPAEMDALVKIRGVGHKTANVILGHIFGKPGIIVDTHVRRLTYRLGFTKNTEPEKIEIDMQKILPAADWTPVSMRLILHGRQICDARKPQCEICAIADDCPRIGVGKRAKRSRSRILRSLTFLITSRPTWRSADLSCGGSFGEGRLQPGLRLFTDASRSLRVVFCQASVLRFWSVLFLADAISFLRRESWPKFSRSGAPNSHGLAFNRKAHSFN